MILDIVVAIILLLSFLTGYRRGAIYMLFFFIGFIVALLAALKLSHITQGYLNQWFNIGDQWAPMLAFAVTFLLAFWLVRLIANFLVKLLKIVHLNFVNKLIGGALGAVISVFALAITLWYVAGLELFTPQLKESSRTLPMLIELAPKVIEIVQDIIPFMHDLLDKLNEMFDKIGNEKSA